MTSAAKRKGDTAEREAAHLLADLTGWPVRPRLQQGRPDDVGDLEGLPDCTVQVRWYRDPLRAQRDALLVLPTQQALAGTTFAAALIRHPGHRWVIAMSPEMFVSLLREATAP